MRLTARNKNGEPYYPYCFREDTCGGYGKGEKCLECKFDKKIIEKLANYEDQEERWMNRWTPVEERMPEEHQLVWVSVEYNGGDIESVEGIFTDGELCRMSGVSLGLIAKAWMPRHVPAPYKPCSQKLKPAAGDAHRPTLMPGA